MTAYSIKQITKTYAGRGHYNFSQNCLVIIIIIIIIIIKDPEEFGKKLVRNDRCGHYSGQSSRMKESWSNTLLNRCTRMDRR